MLLEAPRGLALKSTRPSRGRRPTRRLSMSTEGASSRAPSGPAPCPARASASDGPTLRRPQWNGCTEQANRTARIEFWNLVDRYLTVEAVSKELPKHEFFHNYRRPHSAIDHRSPSDCLVALEAAQPQCQM